MTEFQMKLLNGLTPMSKETFKEILVVNEDVQIFYGNPREPGILGRAYFAAFEDNTYIISYIDWDYTEEEYDSQIVETFNNYDDFWTYLIKMLEDEDYCPEYNFLSESSPSTINEALGPKVDKETLRKKLNWQVVGLPLFHTRGLRDYTTYTASISIDGLQVKAEKALDFSASGLAGTPIATFHSFDDLWDWIIKMVSDKQQYVACYNYVDSRLAESLTESKRDPFHEAIFEAIDYLTEFSDIFPVPGNIGAADWEELKDDINYGLSSDFEIAEILMEYLKKDIAIGEKHPEIFEDDPQSELTLETYIRLKRAFDRAVAAYEAAHPEDFQENFFNESQSAELNESFIAAASTLVLDIFHWTVGGYIGFTVGGWIWDRTKDLIQAFVSHIRKVTHKNIVSQWIAYKSYLIEITKDYQINIWNPGGDQIATNLFSVEAAKRKIDKLPIPEIISEFSVAIEEALTDAPPTPEEQALPDVELDISEALETLEESFTPEEMEEYNIDEDGNSLDSYDTYVRCTWCDEIFTEDQCSFEANLGWLCDRCYSAITSRGERLSIISNPTEEDKARVMTEAFEEEPIYMTADELKATFGTDNIDIINAGRDETPVALKLEEAAERENEVNSSEIDGLDFEEACEKYGIKVEN